ncbi:hypothetical protein AAFF_G00130310 [Aldrovandia affinis]|uniref:Uncharacterized protein n=1 Tax=Aldrovandia affinis TaxID=143900 RepID=A0AAD7W9T7_9TELE|nr:hypothetical protein AAFF_G00130310 [Aldrovandia affinis]
MLQMCSNVCFSDNSLLAEYTGSLLPDGWVLSTVAVSGEVPFFPTLLADELVAWNVGACLSCFLVADIFRDGRDACSLVFAAGVGIAAIIQDSLQVLCSAQCRVSGGPVTWAPPISANIVAG